MKETLRRIFIVLIFLSIVSLFSIFTLKQSQLAYMPDGDRLHARQERMLKVTKPLENCISPESTITSTSTSSTTKPPSTAIHSSIQCTNGPKKNLMFLKTHKTGSSTVQNVLVRHANKNNLFIALPAYDILFNYHSGLGFRRDFVKKTPADKTVNMLVHHMVFNKKEVAAVLPPDTIYFTILRDPATQFESVFKYLNRDVRAFRRVKGGMKEFLTNPEKYYKGEGDGHIWWFGKNNVMYDLGFNNTNETDQYIQESIEEIDKTFQLVLISEYFDISLLLLKDLLCLDMRDIVYLSMNARNQSSVEHVTSDVTDLIYNWNKADTALYKHYNKTFWQRVEKYGKERMEKDLLEFEILKNETANFCVEDKLLNNKDVKDKSLKMFNPQNIDIGQYKLKEEAKNNMTCRGMILPEKAWYNIFSNRQYRHIPQKKTAAKYKMVKQQPGNTKTVIPNPADANENV
uniref:galactose-3-O-sulfotransferase 2-like n=1 Tax=Styela clava TaxID=7725 RepID=UPI00193968D2|nr:galactose-3-O-sulfotransferase 2-like [Styela clava]